MAGKKRSLNKRKILGGGLLRMVAGAKLDNAQRYSWHGVLVLFLVMLKEEYGAKDLMQDP